MRTDEARDTITRYQLDPSSALREAWPFHPGMMLAMIAHGVDDPALARRVMAEPMPYRACWTHYHTGSTGPVTRALGICALTLGDHASAVTLLDEALDTVTRYGYEGLAARLKLELAEALQARGATGDANRANTLLDEVRVAADRIDAPAPAERADRLQGGSPV